MSYDPLCGTGGQVTCGTAYDDVLMAVVRSEVLNGTVRNAQIWEFFLNLSEDFLGGRWWLILLGLRLGLILRLLTDGLVVVVPP